MKIEILGYPSPNGSEISFGGTLSHSGYFPPRGSVSTDYTDVLLRVVYPARTTPPSFRGPCQCPSLHVPSRDESSSNVVPVRQSRTVFQLNTRFLSIGRFSVVAYFPLLAMTCYTKSYSNVLNKRKAKGRHPTTGD